MSTKRNRGEVVTDTQLLETLARLYDDGENLDGGGVTAARMADDLPVATSTARDRLSRLVDQGRAEVDWGFEDGLPKRAFAPATEDEPEETRRLLTDGGTTNGGGSA